MWNVAPFLPLIYLDCCWRTSPHPCLNLLCPSARKLWELQTLWLSGFWVAELVVEALRPRWPLACPVGWWTQRLWLSASTAALRWREPGWRWQRRRSRATEGRGRFPGGSGRRWMVECLCRGGEGWCCRSSDAPLRNYQCLVLSESVWSRVPSVLTWPGMERNQERNLPKTGGKKRDHLVSIYTFRSKVQL